MAEYRLNRATTTDFSNQVSNFSVDSKQIDWQQSTEGEYYWDIENAGQNLGYYKQIAPLKKAIDMLAVWTAGKGFETDVRTKTILESVTGWGEDTIQSIFENIIVQKKVFGDAFVEIIRNDKGDVLNLKPMDPGSMRIVVNSKGIILRYEQRIGKNQPIKFDPNDILHVCNDRIANEVHGTSVVESVKWVIDAWYESMEDQRLIKHRDKALGIVYYDTDNAGRISYANGEIEKAVNKGEMLGLPKDTAKIEEFPSKTSGDRLQWIQYLENLFYQAVGVPRVIATSQDYTEAASKVGYLTFEPIYTREQTLLEADILAQIGYTIKFNRPPSLHGVVSQDEQKNTGQVGVQQNEVQAQASRVE